MLWHTSTNINRSRIFIVIAPTFQSAPFSVQPQILPGYNIKETSSFIPSSFIPLSNFEIPPSSPELKSDLFKINFLLLAL